MPDNYDERMIRKISHERERYQYDHAAECFALALRAFLDDGVAIRFLGVGTWDNPTWEDLDNELRITDFGPDGPQSVNDIIHGALHAGELAAEDIDTLVAAMEADEPVPNEIYRKLIGGPTNGHD